MKRALRIAIALLAVSLAVAALVLGPYALRVQHFLANPMKGYFADYYLYTSPHARRAARNGQVITILVQPNNSGINSDDPQVHRRDAWWTVFERRTIADELGVVLLVPAFIRPGEDWYIYTHALDRDSLTTERADLERIDLQLIAMIDHARSELTKLGIETDEQVLIQEFSASGMFASRFTALQLPYPAGIFDIESLTDAPFDSATYNTIPQLIYMGSADDNDSLDFADGWDETDAHLVDQLFGDDPLSRWQEAESIYKAEGANVQFLLIDGVGHDHKRLQKYSTELLKKVLNGG